MDKRKLIGILIIIVGLIALIGIIYLIFFYNFTTRPGEVSQDRELVQQTEVVQTEEQPARLPTKPIITAKTSQPSQTEVGQEDLLRMASAFAERFGSYSNQSDYGNIRDLKIFMSSTMQDWADSFIDQARAKKSESSIYYGITTKAIAQEVIKFDEDLGQAEVLVKTQRREAIGTTSNTTVFYQDIVIKFVRQKGIWKVDGAYWRDK